MNVNTNMNMNAGSKWNKRMDMNYGMNMAPMNKISPEGGGANHWCWDEDDF